MAYLSFVEVKLAKTIHDHCHLFTTIASNGGRGFTVIFLSLAMLDFLIILGWGSGREGITLKLVLVTTGL